MNKKLLSVFLVIAIIIQLAFPVGALISAKIFENNFEKYGQTYKIKLESLCYDCYGIVIDEEEFGTVSYYIDEKLPDTVFSAAYAQITVGEDGYAKLLLSDSKPTGENYLKRKYCWDYDFLEDYGYIKKYNIFNSVRFIKSEPKIDDFMFYGEVTQQVNDLYVEAKIYKGRGVALGFYVDGEKLEDVLQRLSDKS